MNRIRLYLRLAYVLRLTSHIFKSWKLLALAAYFFMSTVPHIRIQDTYGSHPNRYQNYRTCLYLGNRGIIEDDHGIAGHGCPLLVLMNPTSKRKFYE